MSPLTARIPARRPVPRRGFCTTIHTLIPRSCSARGERARVQRYRLCSTSRQSIDRRTSSGWSKISVAGHRRPVDLVDPFDCRRRPAGPDSQARRRSRYRCPMPDLSVATSSTRTISPYVPRTLAERREAWIGRSPNARPIPCSAASNVAVHADEDINWSIVFAIATRPWATLKPLRGSRPARPGSESCRPAARFVGD